MTIKATATTGTTTATAIFPPADRPEVVEGLGLAVARAAEPDEEDDDFELLELGVLVSVGNTGVDWVDVTTIVCSADWVLPAASTGAGKTDVITCVEAGACGGDTTATGVVVGSGVLSVTSGEVTEVNDVKIDGVGSTRTLLERSELVVKTDDESGVVDTPDHIQ